MTNIPVESEDHWHALRKQHIGSTDIACLFDAHPRKTRWQLWAEKRGLIADVDLSDVSVVKAGKHLEAGIAAWAAEEWGMNLRKVRRYIEHGEATCLGTSLDYESSEGQMIPVEIKLHVWGEGWEWGDGAEIADAPLHYLFQCQHHCVVTGAPYAWLVCYSHGNLRRMKVPLRATVAAEIISRGAAFWAAYVAGTKEPPPDFEEDAEAIQRLVAGKPMASLDLSANDAVISACKQMKHATKVEADAAKKKAGARAEIMKVIMEQTAALGLPDETGARVKAGDYSVVFSSVAATEPTVITTEMVGQSYGGRKGYRALRVNEGKEMK